MEAQELTVKIKYKDDLREVKIPTSATILELKEAIFPVLSVRASDQRLIFKGRNFCKTFKQTLV